ncbi:MAG: SPOR domain-containing protein [Pseudomonadota bacterium]|nr:SPOR domain-containing protein [Pseudomonadota bacterium]
MDGLKQRIIGALVLVSLAVIFVPMLFDEPHTERTSTTINIPEEPPFPEVEAPETTLPATPAQSPGQSDEPGYRILEEAPPETSTAGPEQAAPERDTSGEAVKTDQPVAETGESAARETAAPEPAETESSEAESTKPESAEYQRSLEGAWVVQLGSFGNADNARRLRDRVREKGYGSHLQQVTQGDTTFTRVFSGPFATESEAKAAKRALDDAFGLNSLVTSGGK